MTRRPNIVFLLADDLGHGDFSAFNNGLSSTPTLDGLIHEGTCLTQHYSASPVCNPSRACLLLCRDAGLLAVAGGMPRPDGAGCFPPGANVPTELRAL